MSATELSKTNTSDSSIEVGDCRASDTTTSAMTTTAYVIDDDTSSRELLASLLRRAGIDVQTFASATGFLSAYIDDPTSAHCIVTDLCMPEVDGLGLQQQMASSGARVPIIFVSGTGSVSSAVDAMKLGAVDFLQKPIDPERLLASVAHALRSDRDAAQQYCQRKFVDQRILALTPREREVLALLVQARGTKEIATDLKISVKTVFVHRARVMEKMGVNSLVQLSKLASGNPTLVH